MARQAADSIGIESILRRQLHTLVGRVELVGKTDAVGYLGAELEPLEIEIATEAYFAEIIHQVEKYGFVSVATHIDTHTAASDDVRAVVAFAFSRPFEIQREIDRHRKHIYLRAILSRRTLHRIAGLGLITECAAHELHTRTEPQVQIAAQAQV